MKSLLDLRFIPKPSPFLQIPSTHLPFSLPIPPSTSFSKISTTHLPNPTKTHLPTKKLPSFFKNLSLFTSLSLHLPSSSSAAEAEQVSDKINIESILISIDDFFNRYPFFVAGCAFIWLVVLPLTEEYFKKYKFVSAIDAFRKLRDLPNSELLDIRKKQSIDYLNSPNLKVLNKSVAQVEFVEGEEEGFVAEVLKRFGDPENTVLCVVDRTLEFQMTVYSLRQVQPLLMAEYVDLTVKVPSVVNFHTLAGKISPMTPDTHYYLAPCTFDGNSMKAAELLFKNGFKEVYAIKGGLRGKDGWQAIQETLLPPSVHVYPRKKKSQSVRSDKNRERIDKNNSSNGQVPPASSEKQENKQNAENGHTKPMATSLEAKLANGRALSPYPKYPDMKPPSSPTPSKPQS